MKNKRWPNKQNLVLGTACSSGGRPLRPAVPRGRRGIALYETLLATFLFTATTLALVASTAGIYRLNEGKGSLNSAVAGSHSLIEKILAADFNSSLFYNQTGQVTILGAEVPATANVLGLQYVITWSQVDNCTRVYHVKCTWPDGQTQREYNANTIKTCNEFDETKAYALDGSGNPSNEEVYDDVLVGLGVKDPDPTPTPTATATAAPTATATAAPTSTYVPNPTPTQHSSGGGGGSSGCGCFIGGTLISMADGSFKPIEDVKVGDLVFSLDERSDATISSSVAKTFVHPGNTAGYLIINGIKATPNHPLFVDGQWKEAGEIELGDKLRMLDGSEHPVDSIEYIPGINTVYNFEVAGTHNYFANSVLGHNPDGIDVAANDKFNDMSGCAQ